MPRPRQNRISVTPGLLVIMDSMYIPEDSPSGQVTAVISHYVRPGRESGYEQWLQGIFQAARQFDGHSSVTILRPQPGTRAEYVIILRFDSYDRLNRWMRSRV